jgi:hypothetical protein
VGICTPEHLCSVLGPSPTSEEEVFHCLSALPTCALIGRCHSNSVEVSVESCHTCSELSEYAGFLP